MRLGPPHPNPSPKGERELPTECAAHSRPHIANRSIAIDELRFFHSKRLHGSRPSVKKGCLTSINLTTPGCCVLATIIALRQQPPPSRKIPLCPAAKSQICRSNISGISPYRGEIPDKNMTVHRRRQTANALGHTSALAGILILGRPYHSRLVRSLLLPHPTPASIIIPTAGGPSRSSPAR